MAAAATVAVKIGNSATALTSHHCRRTQPSQHATAAKDMPQANTNTTTELLGAT